MANSANAENQQINEVLFIWYNGEFGKFRKSTDQQRFFVPIQKNLKMAKKANSENQQNNGVLGICYNSKFGKFGKSTDRQSFKYMV